MSKFELAFKIVVGHEGGYQANPKDRGNWTGGAVGKGELRGTKYGISAASYPKADIKNLSLDDAYRVYKRDYWDRIYGDFQPPALALAAFDTAVNSGVNKARQLLYETRSPQEYLDKRLAYALKLAENPAYADFKTGWTNRINKLKEQVAQWEIMYPTAVLLFDWPVQPYSEYTVWDGGGFLDPLYRKSEGSQHPGSDFNGRGGGDTDKGKPVRCTADGTVMSVEWHRVIGNAIVVRHTPELFSVYWHVDKPTVAPGESVKRGQQIAVIGKGAPTAKRPEGAFYAHLHFELRRNNLPDDEWPSLTMNDDDAIDYIAKTRYNAVTFLRAVGANMGEVAKAPNVKDIPATPIKTPDLRVLINDDGQGWKEITGERKELSGTFIVNAEDTDTVYIRRK